MIRDKNLIKKALKSEVVGIIISVTVGLILGLTVAHWGPELNLPTTEMTDRGQERSIYFNIIIALLSGVGVAISMTGGMVSSLVGVAISVSLLPPIVNAGMLLMIAIVGESFVPNPPFYNPPQLYLYAARSFFLFIVNIVCVYIAGIIIFKVKAVVPIATEASSFWTDIKDILNQDPKDHPWNRKAITGVSVDDTAGDKQPPPPRYSSPEWRAQLAARLQALLPSDDYVSTIQKLHDYTSTVM